MRFERLILAMGTMAATGIGSGALAAIDPLEAITVCSRITKADARLECYDQVAKDTAEGVLKSTPDWAAPPVGGPPERPRQVAPQQEFGSEQLPRTSEERKADAGPDSIRAEVASSTDNGLGQWRIRLSDGAIWEMTDSDRLFRPPAPREIVRIRRASMGSFLMDVGSQGSVRVRRVH